jgi:AhpD family alkylhydroperoxidase
MRHAARTRPYGPAYAAAVARLEIPDGPGGDAAMVWTLRPEMTGMVDRMIRGAYQQSALPAAEREVARMRIAQLNDCAACSTFRAQSVRDAGVDTAVYEHLHEYATYPGYTERQRLAIEYAERFVTAHDSIDDAFFARLRAAFADAEVLDLTLCIAVFLGLGRTLAVLGIDEHCELDV